MNGARGRLLALADMPMAPSNVYNRVTAWYHGQWPFGRRMSGQIQCDDALARIVLSRPDPPPSPTGRDLPQRTSH